MYDTLLVFNMKTSATITIYFYTFINYKYNNTLERFDHIYVYFKIKIYIVNERIIIFNDLRIIRLQHHLYVKEQ